LLLASATWFVTIDLAASNLTAGDTLAADRLGPQAVGRSGRSAVDELLGSAGSAIRVEPGGIEAVGAQIGHLRHYTQARTTAPKQWLDAID
jgi:hypothetical protein